VRGAGAVEHLEVGGSADADAADSVVAAVESERGRTAAWAHVCVIFVWAFCSALCLLHRPWPARSRSHRA